MKRFSPKGKPATCRLLGLDRVVRPSVRPSPWTLYGRPTSKSLPIESDDSTRYKRLRSSQQLNPHSPFLPLSTFSLSLSFLSFLSLTLPQVLNYSFVNVNAVERQGKRKKWEKMPPRLARLLERLEAMLARRWWKHTVAAVVLLGEGMQARERG